MRDIPQVVLFPSPLLRRSALKVHESMFGTSQFRDYVQHLANLAATTDADVFASTQSSFDPAWDVLLTRPAAGGGWSTLVNPEIKDEGGGANDFDRSASFLSVPVVVSYPSRFVVRYRMVDGSKREVVCQRSGAKALFQGIESLRGRPIIQRLSVGEAFLFTKRYREELDERLGPVMLPGDPRLLLPKAELTPPPQDPHGN